MSAKAPIELVLKLLELARAESGFTDEERVRECVTRLAMQLSADRPEKLLWAQLEARDPELLAAVHQSISIGETFVFRQPEHFEFLRREVLPRFAGKREVRAWSAGCSTGEEAYTLAAVLVASLPGVEVSVLGTDLDRLRVARAKQGLIPKWAVRSPPPLETPLLGTPRGTGWEVLPQVRAVTRFECHNLLSGPPGTFELIFCRNVLIYFTPDAVERATSQLVKGLSSDGVLVLGAIEVASPPAGTRREGPAELQAFSRGRAPGFVAAPSVTRLAPAPSAPDPVGARPKPEIALHLEAMALLDHRNLSGSAELLDELCRRFPLYLPGLLDRALLHDQLGERRQATSTMRRVIELAKRLAPGARVQGPEALSADYYLESATAFLTSRAAGGAR